MLVKNDFLKKAGWQAGLVSLIILGLFYYWFAIADRYQVFLYGHLGATPFDPLTASRYWMAALVAAGVVMVGYTGLNWALGRILPAYIPPTWPQVWSVCLVPLGIGIPAIVMTVNRPTLPLGNALSCLLASLLGLALALLPGDWAARQPIKLGWLIADGAGLVLPLLLWRAIELPALGLISWPTAYLAAIGGLAAGSLWLGLMTLLRIWRRCPDPGAGALLVSGLCWSYLLLPLVHHLLFTPPGYRYITAAANFFAQRWEVQLTAWAISGGMAMVVSRLRRKFWN